MSKVTSKDCLACGACCSPGRSQDAFCDLTPEEAMRLKKKVRLKVFSLHDMVLARIDGSRLPYAAISTKVVQIKKGPLKGGDLTVCVALAGDPMHKVRCTIYKKRPSVCHTAVRPGDEACLMIRRAFKSPQLGSS